MKIDANFNNPLYLFTNMTNKQFMQLGNLLIDYATIKNGSYNKLVSAYYEKTDNETKKKYPIYNAQGLIEQEKR